MVHTVGDDELTALNLFPRNVSVHLINKEIRETGRLGRRGAGAGVNETGCAWVYRD